MQVVLDEAIKHSYHNFHAKGLDYICLSRSDELTLKLYFLDGDVTKLPEVVNPHDHRYPFDTVVLAGGLLDYRFEPCDERLAEARAYQRHEYRTPLNGGDGFTWRSTEYLRKTSTHYLPVGSKLETRSDHIHTIRPTADQTVLMLTQYADVVPLDEPTTTYVREGHPTPSLDGLYERFTPDLMIERLRTIAALSGLSISWR